MMDSADRVLQEAAKARGCTTAELVHWQVDNPFFRQWTIWRVEMNAMPAFPLSVASRAESAQLIEFDDGFHALTEAEPLSLHSESDAVDYVRFFVATAKPDAEVLDSLDDVAGVPDDKLAMYQTEVAPPLGEKTAAGYRVTAYLLDEAKLLRCQFDIDPRGAITTEDQLIEKEISIFVAIE